MRPFKFSALTLVYCVLGLINISSIVAYAWQTPEYRMADEYHLTDKLIRADREVEMARLHGDEGAIAKANAKSESAGAALTVYCQAHGKKVGMKAYGIVGCLPEQVPWVPKKK